jgi:hypothetical protein
MIGVSRIERDRADLIFKAFHHSIGNPKDLAVKVVSDLFQMNILESFRIAFHGHP